MFAKKKYFLRLKIPVKRKNQAKKEQKNSKTQLGKLLITQFIFSGPILEIYLWTAVFYM